VSALSRLAGRLLLVGFEGPPEPLLDALAAGRAGGVILFARNIESADATRALTGMLRKAGGGAVPIGVDQEGGRVARLDRAGVAAGPCAREVAAGGDPAAAHRWGEATGRTLAELGFTLDFAPVLDVDTNPDNPVIGDRAFASDPDTVTAFGREAARGLAAAGITPCGKHFPGHGDTALDSHRALPVVEHGPERLEAVELRPFAALAGELPAIMTAHVVYPAWDPDRPATLSGPILTGILRGRLGFAGAIVSDDLEMAAVADRHGPEESAVLAVAAGVDVVLVGKTQSVWERAHEGLVREAEASPAFRARLEAAARAAGHLTPSTGPARAT
jgi:beta-N-acetylhexosaminidase